MIRNSFPGLRFYGSRIGSLTDLRKLAVISDVHANLEAVQAVLPHLEGMEVYCLGDFVDYGANPNEVIGVLRDRRVRSIVGNHDLAALTGDVSLFNARAAMSSKWTASRLNEESVAYLRGLPQELRLNLGDSDAYFTHGSPEDKLWEYVDPRTHSDLFSHYLSKVNAQYMGLGHTHIPYVWKNGYKLVFNPGSVGQPRDGDRRASFALLSAGEGKVEAEVRRMEYDYEKAASKIRAAGLPDSFAARLKTGS